MNMTTSYLFLAIAVVLGVTSGISIFFAKTLWETRDKKININKIFFIKFKKE